MTLEEKRRKVKEQLEKLNPGQRHKKDDAAYFTLFGGPHHGVTLRLYAPFEEIRFPTSEAHYELHPPFAANGEWIYVHKEVSNETGGAE